MKYLADILPDHGVRVKGETRIPVAGLSLDSRKTEKDYLFAALPGTQDNGSQYIESAIEKGATIILCQNLPAEIKEGITYIEAVNPAESLGLMASSYYGNPTGMLDLVGVTGTNGKTTVTSLLYQLFRKLGFKCGLISTTGIWIENKKLEATHTTPDTITLNAILAEMVEADCDFAFMEVSSHAVAQQRIAGLHFKGGIFTNLTHDHLDYHGTFENYRDAKKGFFDKLDLEAFALTNTDDKNGKFMLQNTKAARLTYGLENMADFKAKILEFDIHGMHLIVDKEEIFTALTGKFNAYNLLAAYAAARIMDVSLEDAIRAISSLQAPEGRFSCIRSKDNVTAVVDYAHTPDALKNILESIREINLGGHKVITVVGCGGNRDKAKRPIMAKIAAEMSEQVILTSDNPRNEDPDDILHDMEAGIPITKRNLVLTITDRKQAIHTACRMANEGDIILVAGKGHEKYQEVQGKKHFFDDTQVLAEYLKERTA